MATASTPPAALAPPLVRPFEARPTSGPRGPFVQALVRTLRNPMGLFGGTILLLLVIAAIGAPLISPFDPLEQHPGSELRAPGGAFLLGTDNLGRDMLSRCLYGAQLSVIIGLSAAALATVVSILIGIVSGYLGGKFDMVMQRFVDAWMSFPDLIILIVVVSVVGPGMGPVIVLLGLLYGIGGSRIIRGAVLSVRENAYVHAAQSTGATLPRILWKHILPNVMAPVIVLFTTRVGAVILAESGLAFLGLGVPPPAPTWGGMLSGSGRSYMYMAPWLALAPGLCITVVVYAINVFGDALRDLLDPRMRGSR